MAALRQALRTDQNVRFALLFGSAARGTDTPASDIDVLVELRDPALDRVIDLSEQLTAASGRPVDVVRLGDAENDPSFLADAVTEGRVLVDRDQRWPRLRSRESALRRRGRHDLARRADAALASIDELLAN
jgi:predicted nucleotidyltransferase